VHVIRPDRQHIWPFVRLDEATVHVPAASVVFDDMAAWVEECMPRLRFV
jgi:hypothetical protein